MTPSLFYLEGLKGLNQASDKHSAPPSIIIPACQFHCSFSFQTE